MRYIARELTAYFAENAAIFADLHHRLFPKIAFPSLGFGHWWVIRCEGKPVAFAHMLSSTYFENTGYFARVGVLPRHRGHGLQLRLMKIAERKARTNGWSAMVSDTTRVPHSAANFEKLGYNRFTPERPWLESEDTIYWRKEFK